MTTNKNMDFLAIRAKITAAWDSKSRKMDFLGMETVLTDILRSNMTDAEKVVASKECIDAFTKRGHFIGSY